MEISVVSVASNLPRPYLPAPARSSTTPWGKSWAESLSRARPVAVTSGWTAPPGGRTKGPKLPDLSTSDADEFADFLDEDELYDVARNIYQMFGIKEYGQTFAHHGQKAVHFTTADSHGTDIVQAAKAKFGAVKGVKAVNVEAETRPPRDEGWRQVYPYKRPRKNYDAGDRPMATMSHKDRLRLVKDSGYLVQATHDHEDTPCEHRPALMGAIDSCKAVQTWLLDRQQPDFAPVEAFRTIIASTSLGRFQPTPRAVGGQIATINPGILSTRTSASR
jgi:hypothetical protein